MSLNDPEDGSPLSRADLMPPPLPTDLVPSELERKTDPAPADPVMRLLSEIASKVDSMALDVGSIKRRVANLAIEVNATKNQAAAATSEARAARDAAVVVNDAVSAIAFMLKDEIGAGLSDLDRKVERQHDAVTTIAEFQSKQIDALFRIHYDHAELPADEAHGPHLRTSGNGNGNGHDPEVTVSAED